MPNQGLATADYLVVAGFFLVMLAIGLYFARRMTSIQDFFSGGKAIPWWISGVSLYMTTFSAFAFVAYSATAYKSGMTAIVIWWLSACCTVLSAHFLAARWRRAATTSPIEFIERRYGPVLRQGFAWTGVPLIMIDDALKLFVIGTMVTGSLGFGHPRALPISILACGSIMLTYTFLGGLWAVMITDFVQFIVMITAVLVLAPLVIMKAGGIASFFSEMPPEMWKPYGPEYPITWLIPFFFIMIFSQSCKWSIVQRYYSVRTDREARRVGYMVGVLTFFSMPLVLLPAFAARIFLPGVEDANTIYAEVCRMLLPAGMLGMIIAAMFSATMSMLSSDYNAVAAVITNDIYRHFRGKRSTDRGLVLVARLSTLLVGIIAMGIAIILATSEGEKDLVKIMAKLFGVLLPPIAIPVIAGLLTRRTSNAGGLGAFIAGCICGLTAYSLSYLGGFDAVSNLLETVYTVFGMEYGGSLEFLRSLPWLVPITGLPALAALLSLTLLLPDSETQRAHVSAFLDGLEGAEEVLATEEIKSGEAVAVLEIIGASGAAMGLVLFLAVLLTGAASGLSLGVGLALAALGGIAVLAGRRIRKNATG
jgi:solute:Na+ symporter, SSS family